MDPITRATEPDPEYKLECPAPPCVHWIALLGSEIVLLCLIAWLVPVVARDFAWSVVVYAWPLYLSFWMRKLNPESNCRFWVVFCLIGDLLSSSQKGGFVLLVLAAFVFRDELLAHYNEREPIQLKLDPVMTFFFSFLYFQSHLYDIAQAKRPQQPALIGEPRLTQLS